MSDSPEPKKTERLVVMVAKDDLKALDDWRYEQQIPSRSEAARRLITLGLETAKKRKRAQPKKD
jgi:metal-responsive CopG/Arc/MetJ family transcriptional regulator